MCRMPVTTPGVKFPVGRPNVGAWQTHKARCIRLTTIAYYDIIIWMSRHERTLRAIFSHPTRGNIKWLDIIALLNSLGATVSQREGSRVAVLLNGRVAVFHRPHPRPETGKATVKDVRTFLENAGVYP
jgi:hypothetical protein